MLTHKQVWEGIDRLAARNQLSASGLAKRAGLDPTTFNKSKRITKQGKPRWPSTESLAKILDATGASMREFVEMMQGGGEGAATPLQRLRCVSLADAEGGACFDASGFPVAGPWEEVDFPLVDDEQAYAIELDRDVLPPVYRSGDLVVVSPAGSIRRGDRVVVQLADGGFLFAVLARRTAQRVVVAELAGGEERALGLEEIAWIARVVWVSQ
ncbi:helix-turn-helix transcriptional regulator [Geminicoccaceae bacterium 1502E]|nr:helix-turn-helix transcriptional regulator [Geminicoccaceae bacterium 1502E]